MELIADTLLAAGALGAAIYCMVLGRRLKRFNDLEKGVGGAVAVLSAQVDDLNRTLGAAQATANKSTSDLSRLTERAETMSKQLELQMASLHDIPAPAEAAQADPVVVTPPAPPPAAKPSEPMFVRHTQSGGPS
ncbi:hypothetical protein [Sulfitobacter sp. S190]|uniref:hypothetical protein n=1 Tax=Sulfitobacter sp. S190 TaxID=2867022 RepID=UPI0021A6DA78|nr:hypothetical protein [Sulfitobacter sp. S190]UWR22359.1 hypothetical protein K3756_17120 [Sulfitobacter sp. S190]